MAVNVELKLKSLYKWRSEMAEEFYYNDMFYTAELIKGCMDGINKSIANLEEIKNSKPQ
jgi:hypothetical protein